MLSGAISVAGIGVLGSKVINSAIDGLEYAVIKAINGEKISEVELWGTMAISFITTQKGLDSRKLKGIYQRSKDVLETAVSPNKIGRYTSKIKNVKLQFVKHIGSMFLDGGKAICSSLLYNFSDEQEILNFR